MYIETQHIDADGLVLVIKCHTLRRQEREQLEKLRQKIYDNYKKAFAKTTFFHPFVCRGVNPCLISASVSDNNTIRIQLPFKANGMDNKFKMTTIQFDDYLVYKSNLTIKCYEIFEFIKKELSEINDKIKSIVQEDLEKRQEKIESLRDICFQYCTLYENHYNTLPGFSLENIRNLLGKNIKFIPLYELILIVLSKKELSTFFNNFLAESYGHAALVFILENKQVFERFCKLLELGKTDFIKNCLDFVKTHSGIYCSDLFYDETLFNETDIEQNIALQGKQFAEEDMVHDKPEFDESQQHPPQKRPRT